MPLAFAAMRRDYLVVIAATVFVCVLIWATLDHDPVTDLRALLSLVR